MITLERLAELKTAKSQALHDMQAAKKQTERADKAYSEATDRWQQADEALDKAFKQWRDE